MSRYFVRPRLAPEGAWDDPMLPQLTVSDHKPVNTGLLNRNGDPIMRAPRPIGFGRDGEW